MRLQDGSYLVEFIHRENMLLQVYFARVLRIGLEFNYPPNTTTTATTNPGSARVFLAKKKVHKPLTASLRLKKKFANFFFYAYAYALRAVLIVYPVERAMFGHTALLVS